MLIYAQIKLACPAPDVTTERRVCLIVMVTSQSVSANRATQAIDVQVIMMHVCKVRLPN